jgi:hypothetical protein
MSRVTIHTILANDDHTVILHDTAMSKNRRAFTSQYADIYYLRNGKFIEHWRLAVDPKADEKSFAN